MLESAIATKTIDPFGWLEDHRKAVTTVLGDIPKQEAVPRWLKWASRLFLRAAKLANKPRRALRARGRMPPHLKHLLHPTTEVAQALNNMFGEGWTLWRAADFMRRLWHKFRRVWSQQFQPYVNGQPHRRRPNFVRS